MRSLLLRPWSLTLLTFGWTNTLETWIPSRRNLLQQSGMLVFVPSLGCYSEEMVMPPDCRDGVIVPGTHCRMSRFRSCYCSLWIQNSHTVQPSNTESAVPGAYQQVCMTLAERSITLKVCGTTCVRRYCTTLTRRILAMISCSCHLNHIYIQMSL
jgi:hypothetical protein